MIDKQEAEWGEKEMLLSSCVCVFVWFIFILCLSWSCWPPLPITNLSCQTHSDSHIKAVHMQESLHTPFISVNKVRGSEGRKVRKNERKKEKKERKRKEKTARRTRQQPISSLVSLQHLRGTEPSGSLDPRQQGGKIVEGSSLLNYDFVKFARSWRITSPGN